MHITLAAIGKFRANVPEQALALDYLARAQAGGKHLGFKSVRLLEIDPKLPNTDKEKEADAMAKAIGNDGPVFLLDERGQDLGSIRFAHMLERHKDSGNSHWTLAIGGADGHGSAMHARASGSFAFGTWVWPHKLVRVMAAEQIYRALSILADTPYHRV